MTLVTVDAKGFFEARLNKFYSQETLAAKAMVSYNFIKKIERGEKVAPEATRKVLNALGISVDEAFSRKLVSYE